MVEWSMSRAYRVVFECPKDRYNINAQKKSSKASLTEDEAMEMFGNDEISCSNPSCGWHGKASKTKVLRILPFNWIFSPAA
jgi:hypothetical protein